MFCKERGHPIMVTEQNRTEQNRTEQNRTEQNRTEQNRTEQIGNSRRTIKYNCDLKYGSSNAIPFMRKVKWKI
jgi:hypothetical protein